MGSDDPGKHLQTQTAEKIVKTLLENWLQLVFLMDPSGMLLAANDRFARQFGCVPQEMVGRCIYDLLPSQVAGSRKAFVDHVARTGKPGRVEDQREGRWLDSMVYPITDGAGRTTGVLVCVDDITERKQMEEKLRRGEERLRLALEGGRLGAWDWHAARGTVLWNDEQFKIFGYERGTVVPGYIAWRDRVHPEDLGAVDALLKQHLKKGGEYSVEYRILCQDGTLRWVESRCRHEVDAKGQAIRSYGVSADITERKQAEEALRESAERYRSLFLNATEGIFQTKPDGRFVSANPALARILGYDTPEGLIARVTDIGKQVITDPDVRSAYLRVLNETGVLRDFECRMRRADGTSIWASINARAVRDENGRVLYYEGTFQDITQRKLARDQLIMQRDISLQLAHLTDEQECLSLILKTALEVSGMQSGGIYLKEEPSGVFELQSSVGLSDNFVRKASRLEVESPGWSFIMTGRSIYRPADKTETPFIYEEGFKYKAMIPIVRDGHVIGSISMFSRQSRDVPEQGRMGLDFLSGESGNIIYRMQARQRLEKEVETRRQAEKVLQETNAALRVLLRHREEDKRELEEKLVSNIKQLVLPYVEKLKRSRLQAQQETMVDFIETNLKEILSSFLDQVQRFNLTPRQIEIAALIKAGRTTKEIAALLAVSKAAVDKHRYLIRQRLNLSNEKTNLRSYLLSLG